MTIDEAIEILKGVVEGGKLITDHQQREASKLGIEALKRERERRKYLVNSCGELLPGETE